MAGESFLQANLQIFILLNDGLKEESYWWRIGSIIISCVSLFYGVCNFELHYFSDEERTPTMSATVLYFSTEILKQSALFLRFLICISLFLFHKDLTNYAIIYMCLCLLLPHLPLIVALLCGSEDTYLSLPINILNPHRIYLSQNIFSNAQLGCYAALTGFISLVGVIILGLFLSSDFDCKDLCEQFENRFERIRIFYIFCVFINSITLVLSYNALRFSCTGKRLFSFVYNDIATRER